MVVVVSFVFKRSSLFSFDLLFVALSSSSCCSDNGDDAVAVVVKVGVVALAVVAVCFLSLASSSSFLFGTGTPGTDFFSAAVASLNFLQSFR